MVPSSGQSITNVSILPDSNSLFLEREFFRKIRSENPLEPYNSIYTLALVPANDFSEVNTVTLYEFIFKFIEQN